MAEEGDRILRAVGVVLVVAIVAAVGIALLAASSAPSRQPTPPDAEWSLERVNSTHVRIVHAGGDPVPAEELVVQANKYERAVTWSGIVEEGESGVVRVGDRQEVRLIWDGGRGQRRQLAAWEVGDYSAENRANATPRTAP